MSRITRYMSIEKCLEFLNKNQLFFSRLDQFEDKSEGYTLYQLAERAGFTIEGIEEDGRAKIEPNQRRKIIFASCWYNGGENLAMWEKYRHERGLAISIERELLEMKFIGLSKEEDLTIKFENSQTDPIDYRQVKIRAGAIAYVSRDSRKSKSTALGFLKHNAFGHEREFRLAVRINDQSNGYAKHVKWSISEFESTPIRLITNPFMKDDFTSMIEGYVQQLGRSNVKVIQSSFRNLFID